MSNTPTWNNFYQMLQQMQQQGLPPPMPSGANDWANNVQSDGSLAGANVSAGPRPQQPPPQVPGVGALPSAAGMAAGNQIFGGGASAASSAAAGAAPAAPTGVMGTVNGTGLTMGPGEFIGPVLPEATWWGAVSPYLFGAAAIGAGAYTVGKGVEAWKNSQYSNSNPITGLKEGIKAGGILNAVPVLGQVPWLAGAIGAQFGSGKDKDQHMRDQVRAELAKTGFLNPDFTFGDTGFDWGKDGNARLPNEGVDPITGQDWRHYYDVDWSKSDAGGLVAAANPLAALFARGDKKLTSDFAGYIVNTARQSDNPLEAIKSMIEKAGMGHDQIYGAIHLMSKGQGGPLDDKLADAYKNGLDQMYGVGAYEGQGSKLGTPDIQYGQKQGQSQNDDDEESTPKPAMGTTPPQGVTGQAQQTVKPRGSSPFVGSSMNGGTRGLVGNQNQGPFIGSKQRISPGVWQDQKGQYLSKSGQRGK